MVSKFSILLYHLLPAGLLQSGKLQTASTEFTHRPKISIFSPQQRLIVPIHVKFGTAEQNFT